MTIVATETIVLGAALQRSVLQAQLAMTSPISWQPSLTCLVGKQDRTTDPVKVNILIGDQLKPKKEQSYSCINIRS